MTIIAGIDEAGKGPVIGPMCIAGVAIDESKLNTIKNLKVRDSKTVTASKRKEFAYQIKKYSDDWYIFEISPQQIDELRKVMTMNQIMVHGFLKVLNKLRPDKAYVDSVDVNSERFGSTLKIKYSESNPGAKQIEIISKHRADSIYPIVSAASIIAKVRRDELIEKIKKEMGIDFGSGYPSDPKTKKFLEEWICENDSFPEFVRHSWKTCDNLIKKHK
ncbi:ribonuclease HII [Methanosalsum zhilinae DSM 4017]|uniref:Ribonuclease HII n=1 Tax=Methanosalsum zhilinae (strain DSM 4017 / NBRC 107636 / OCM 62 / WeN5) TaxID=679901 RepID=F7XPP6_METZD|nr:ribonuclease HII [Methanosalsum zhilinae]AEH60316.1 ribonuclease HII [Methanosalsum zhilinae DSM 4017]